MSTKTPCLLLDLPTELLHSVLWNITDLCDLTTLAQIPQLNERLRQFVRVAGGYEQLICTPEIFHDFPRFPVRTAAPDYSINIFEVDAQTKIPRVLFQELYLTQPNVRNFLLINGMHGFRRVSDEELQWEWPEVTLIEKESKRSSFNLRCVLHITTTSFTIRNCIFNSEAGKITSDNLERLNLIDVTFLGDKCTIENIRPNFLMIENCSSNYIEAIDYDNTEKLTIEYRISNENHVYKPRQGHDPFAIVLDSLRFSHLRTLTLHNVNCLRNLDFPLLESMTLDITPHTKTSAYYVSPLIKDIRAPKCTELMVNIHNMLPEVSEIDMPNCQSLYIKTSNLIPGMVWDLNFADWSEGSTVKSLNEHKLEKPKRIVQRDLHGWPRARAITLNDCSHLFRNHDFLVAGEELTIIFEDYNQESHVDIPDADGSMPKLRSLTIIDKMTSYHGVTMEMFCPQYRVVAKNLQSLIVSRSPSSRLYLNFENMIDNFPVLRMLHLQGCNQLDKFPSGRAVLKHLTTLILEKYNILQIMEMLCAVESAPLETFVIGRSLTSWSDDFNVTELQQQVMQMATERFSGTLKFAILCFDDSPAAPTGLNEFVISGMSQLVELGVGGVKTLAVRDCPLLKTVQVRVLEDWHIIPIDEFEKVGEVFRFNVSGFMQSLRDSEDPLSSAEPSYSAKRKASRIITKAETTKLYPKSL